MKRILLLCLSAALLSTLLVGCGSGSTTTTTTTTGSTTSTTSSSETASDSATTATESSAEAADVADSQAEAGYSYTYQGVVLEVGQSFQEAYASLGEPNQYFEAASCAFDGLDKIFYYAGLEIKTCPEGDEDYILNILLKDDSITTDNGTYIGQPIADALACEGDDYEANGTMYTYTKGETYLVLIESDGVIVSINFGWTVL